MDESIYDQVASRIFRVQMVIFKIHVSQVGAVNAFSNVTDEGQSDQLDFRILDQFKATSEIDQFKKEYPDNYKIYLTKFLEQYIRIANEIDTFDISSYTDDSAAKVINIFSECVKYITEHLKGLLNPEYNIQEQPQKFEKLKPIEKILIIHYLNIDSLKPINSQLHIKPGIHFISRLFDINPSSIKDAVLKIANYTIDDNSGKLPKIEANTANQYIPVLKKVKSFFEDSDLKSISKEVEKRIEVLNEISGKNF